MPAMRSCWMNVRAGLQPSMAKVLCDFAMTVASSSAIVMASSNNSSLLTFFRCAAILALRRRSILRRCLLPWSTAALLSVPVDWVGPSLGASGGARIPAV